MKKFRRPWGTRDLEQSGAFTVPECGEMAGGHTDKFIYFKCFYSFSRPSRTQVAVKGPFCFGVKKVKEFSEASREKGEWID